MEWTRSETLALAMHNCTQCHGSGLRLARKELFALQLRAARDFPHLLGPVCALRDAGKALEPGFARAARGPLAPVYLGAKRRRIYRRFLLVARRALDDFEHRLFRYHFLLGADWKLCARRLGIDRGNFFHAVYRIEQKLGRVFREIRPYPLFPLDEYFNGPSRSARRASAQSGADRPARGARISKAARKNRVVGVKESIPRPFGNGVWAPLLPGAGDYQTCQRSV